MKLPRLRHYKWWLRVAAYSFLVAGQTTATDLLGRLYYDQGMLGLIFEVSSLFSNVINTLALPVVPILAVILFHDKIDGVKVMALLLAIWGFLSYMYQHYLDDSKSKVNKTSTNEASGTGAVIDVC
uniref:Uncharacterized protein n=1 Tax=Quercus lobata TaxID=97700 RepID=A0A7N2REB6_QUELO